MLLSAPLKLVLLILVCNKVAIASRPPTDRSLESPFEGQYSRQQQLRRRLSKSYFSDLRNLNQKDNHEEPFAVPPMMTSRPVIEHECAVLRPVVHVTSFSTEVRKGKRGPSPTVTTVLGL